MLDPTAATRSAVDQPLGHEPVGQRAERLVALERLDREGVGRSARNPSDRPHGVPLGERRADRRQPGIEGPVMSVLDLLDPPPERLHVSH